MDIPLMRKIVSIARAEVDRTGADEYMNRAGVWYQGAWLDTPEFQQAMEEAQRSGKPQTIAVGEIDCGSTACLCGHLASYLRAEVTIAPHYILFDGMSPHEYGQKHFGITYEQAIDLFSGGNDIADVEFAFKEITGEPL